MQVRKLSVFLLSLMLIFTLAACSGNAGTNASGSSNGNSNKEPVEASVNEGSETTEPAEANNAVRQLEMNNRRQRWILTWADG